MFRKLDALEKLVRKGGPGSLLGPGPASSETPKNKWLNAARDGLTKRSTLVSRITKTGSGKETSGTGKIELPVKLNNETVALENERKKQNEELRLKNDLSNTDIKQKTRNV